MGRMARSCIQSLLKVVNSGLGMTGIAMVLYSLWMLRVLLRRLESDHAPVPWFIYTILGVGITLCVITCSGHIAAETANGCCLYIDFPEDPTGYFDQLKSFIRENFDICKWIGLTVVALQGPSMLLAMILKALGPYRERYYASSDEYLPDRVPLLKNYVPPQSYVVSDQPSGPRTDSWNVRVNSKVSRIRDIT